MLTSGTHTGRPVGLAVRRCRRSSQGDGVRAGTVRPVTGDPLHRTADAQEGGEAGDRRQRTGEESCGMSCDSDTR